MNHEIPDVQAGFRKGRGTRDQIANRDHSVVFEIASKYCMFKLVLEKAEEPKTKLRTSTGSWKKQESSRKTSISALLTMPKPLTVWLTINCGKF